MTRPLGAFLFLLVFGAGLLTYGGTFHNPADEWLAMSMTESLVKHRALDVDQMYWVGEHLGFARYGADGHLYTRYSVALAVVGAPFYALGLAFAALGAAQTALLVNAVVVALTAVVVLQIVTGLGYGRGVGTAMALLYAFATPVLTYGKSYYSEPLAGLLLAGGVYLLLRSGPARRTLPVALAGLLLGLLGLTKPSNLVLALPAGLFVIWPVLRKPVSASSLRPVLAFGGPFAIGVVLLMLTNLIRFGSPFDFGYGAERDAFGGNLLLGAYGLLFSPGRGIFVYAPFLVVSLFGLSALDRRYRGAGWLFGGTAALAVLTYGAWNAWHGGSAQWGPRFLIPVVPLLVVMAAPVVEWVWSARRAPALAVGVAAIAASVVIQLSGSFVNYMAYVGDLAIARGITPDREDEQLTSAYLDPAASPILAQLRYLAPEHSDVSWLRVVDGEVTLAWGPPVASGVVVLLAAAGVATALRRSPTPLQDASAAGLLLLACAAAFAVLDDAARHPYWGGEPVREAIVAAGSSARPGDVLVTEGPAMTATALNFDRSRVQRVGMPDAVDWIDPAMLEKATLVDRSARTIWLIQSPARDVDLVLRHLQQAGRATTRHEGPDWVIYELTR